MSAGDPVNLVAGETPADYHCSCSYCCQVIGQLRPPEDGYYSRLERRAYYDKAELGKKGHIAKTPLHIARWAIQAYTQPGDWVLDPTIGSGTTAVEAVTQGRNAAGMEVQYGAVLKANIAKNLTDGVRAEIKIGDARFIGKFLDELNQEFALVINNPPYSADQHAGDGFVNGPPEYTPAYKSSLPNLAFLKEGSEYWDAISQIYSACIKRLRPGGHFVIGVKDMMRRKKPYMLHEQLCELMTALGMRFEGTAFLKHHPTTLFLNTYEKRYGVRPPLYQTISVFRKEEKTNA